MCRYCSCIRAWRADIDAPTIAHLVLDEAEDFSLFELFVLGRLLGDMPSVTLAGDEAQETAGSFAGWSGELETLGVADAVICRLSVSYRCPAPIVELAQALLGELAPHESARAARDGAPVGFFCFPDRDQATLFLVDSLRDLCEREPDASLAVIARRCRCRARLLRART